MRLYKCDQTGETCLSPRITLDGFTRRGDSGILLPEQNHVKHFVSRDAFVDWIKEALEQEGYVISNNQKQ